jgi:hypothetical protein
MNSNLNELNELPVYVWILLACLLLPQGIFLFRDAQKHGENPWLWGIWGLTTVPMPILLYLIFVRKIFKRKRIR